MVVVLIAFMDLIKRFIEVDVVTGTVEALPIVDDVGVVVLTFDGVPKFCGTALACNWKLP